MRVFWKDIDLIYQGCNHSFAVDSGFQNPDEIIGKSDSQLAWQDRAEAYQNDDRQVILTGLPKLNIEENLLNHKGETLTLLTNKIPMRDSAGNVCGVLGTYIDITHRKIEEQQLQQSYDFVESLVRTIPFGMDIVDESGTILFHSDNFKKLFGEDAIGKKCWDLYRENKVQCITVP